MVQKQTSTEKTAKENLFDYVASLSEEQINKLIDHLPLLKSVVNMDEPQAIYTEALITKLFPAI